MHSESEPSTGTQSNKGSESNIVVEESSRSEKVDTFTPHIVLSVVAIVFCGVLFGVVALVFALKARRLSGPAAKRSGNVSLILSAVGIVVGVGVGVIVGLAVGLTTSNPSVLSTKSTSKTSSLYIGCDSPKISGSDGNCYDYELFSSDPTACSRLPGGLYDPASRICFYNRSSPR